MMMMMMIVMMKITITIDDQCNYKIYTYYCFVTPDSSKSFDSSNFEWCGILTFYARSDDVIESCCLTTITDCFQNSYNLKKIKKKMFVNCQILLSRYNCRHHRSAAQCGFTSNFRVKQVKPVYFGIIRHSRISREKAQLRLQIQFVILFCIDETWDICYVQLNSWYNRVKQRQHRLIQKWGTLLECQFLVIVLRIRHQIEVLGAALATTV